MNYLLGTDICSLSKCCVNKRCWNANNYKVIKIFTVGGPMQKEYFIGIELHIKIFATAFCFY